ncbi:MAG TPA: hypothetical protein VE398_06205 [Acidobacteriota bacterium]|nr:hypothetical protein [Acidobacteriota bacterium]
MVRASTVILGLPLLAFDAILALWLWMYGLPKKVTISSKGEGYLVKAEPARFVSADWLILALLTALHLVLAYLIWRSWHPKRMQE